MKFFSYNTFNNLVFLIFVFIFGLSSLVLLHMFFLNLISELDKKTENMEKKIQIGQYIVDDLHKMRSDFYEITTVITNNKEINRIEEKIEKHILNIKKSLKVLQKGGTLKRVIRLNIVGHNDTVKTVEYKNTENGLSLESIELLPKLEEFRNMTKQSIRLLKLRLKNKTNAKKLMQTEKRIKRFYKRTPPFFSRIIENANRLLYETSKELEPLKKEILEKKEKYLKLEILIIIAILCSVLILSIFIAIQINKNSKRLERQKKSIRGILDGQRNIVVVSNGRYMLDSNKALVDFFLDFDSFEDFSKEHRCICDFFEDMNDEDYVIDTNYDGKTWFEHVLSQPQKVHKVAMDSGEELHHFILTVTKKFIENDNFILVVTLNNITELINIQKELNKLNNNLELIVEEKTKELKSLNENLEKKVQVEVEKNREKDKVLIQQGRLAAMGEMIANIAHQWRQPLSAIYSTSTAMQLHLEMGLDSREEIVKSYDKIGEYVEFLNTTIEDFRNFFQKNSVKIDFNIMDVINSSISIIESSYKNNSIATYVETSKDEFIINNLKSEFSQVILNILTNAKDALKKKNTVQKIVKIEVYDSNKSYIIKIYDNAGGINNRILHKIFDPYFTTKHQSQGTGIGLYMSKQIIEKHMDGSLVAKNEKFTQDDKEYFGACFKIELPKF